MNSIKQILNFELNFLSNRIPYIKRNQTDGKINYFCIYRYYFNDGIKIYKVEPNQIAILDFKDNKIKENQYKVKNSGKITVKLIKEKFIIKLKDDKEFKISIPLFKVLLKLSSSTSTILFIYSFLSINSG